MKCFAWGFLLLAVGCLAFTGCATTASVNTQTGPGSGVSKSAPHFIMKPRAGDTTQAKDLYPLVVNAFQQNHIALTSNQKDAVYFVSWRLENRSNQVKSLQNVNPGGYSGMTNVNSYDVWGGPMNGMPVTGPQYATVMRSYEVQNFTISVWKQEGGKPTTTVVWNGTAEVGAKDAKNPSAIINAIVARYGTTFHGTAQIKP